MLMKRLTIALLLLCCACLSACSSSLKDQITNVPTQTKDVFRVYVFGAVLNEGYVEVDSSTTVETMLNTVGLCEQSSYPKNSLEVLTKNTKTYFVEYMLDGVTYSCVNVNGLYVVTRSKIENVDEEVVNKLADYLEEYGTITNKNVMREILGEEDYQNNYYKFYVSVDDYEGN